jgi:hypothetical protein
MNLAILLFALKFSQSIYREEVRDQALRTSGNLPNQGKVPKPAQKGTINKKI